MAIQLYEDISRAHGTLGFEYGTKGFQFMSGAMDRSMPRKEYDEHYGETKETINRFYSKVDRFEEDISVWNRKVRDLSDGPLATMKKSVNETFLPWIGEVRRIREAFLQSLREAAYHEDFDKTAQAAELQEIQEGIADRPPAQQFFNQYNIDQSDRSDRRQQQMNVKYDQFVQPQSIPAPGMDGEMNPKFKVEKMIVFELKNR